MDKNLVTPLDAAVFLASLSPSPVNALGGNAPPGTAPGTHPHVGGASATTIIKHEPAAPSPLLWTASLPYQPGQGSQNVAGVSPSPAPLPALPPLPSLPPSLLPAPAAPPPSALPLASTPTTAPALTTFSFYSSYLTKKDAAPASPSVAASAASSAPSFPPAAPALLPPTDFALSMVTLPTIPPTANPPLVPFLSSQGHAPADPPISLRATGYSSAPNLSLLSPPSNSHSQPSPQPRRASAQWSRDPSPLRSTYFPDTLLRSQIALPSKKKTFRDVAASGVVDALNLEGASNLAPAIHPPYLSKSTLPPATVHAEPVQDDALPGAAGGEGHASPAQIHLLGLLRRAASPALAPIRPPTDSPLSLSPLTIGGAQGPSPSPDLDAPSGFCPTCNRVCGHQIIEEQMDMPTSSAGFLYCNRTLLGQIRRETQTQIKVVARGEGFSRFKIRGHEASVYRAAEKFELLRAERGEGRMPSPACLDRVHVFVDFSNIFLGAKDCGIALDVKTLARTLENGRGKQCATREIVGTNLRKQQIADGEAMGYNVHSYDRTGKEVLIDNMIHAQILDVVSDVRRYPAPQTLVIATGDGNANEGHGNTSFPKCVERALDHNFSVEIWSWRQSVSPVYTDMVGANPLLRIFFLDDYYHSMT